MTFTAFLIALAIYTAAVMAVGWSLCLSAHRQTPAPPRTIRRGKRLSVFAPITPAELAVGPTNPCDAPPGAFSPTGRIGDQQILTNKNQ